MPINIISAGDLNKIDSQNTLGLLGTSNSLAYRVQEIEKHFHGEERWYGNDGDATASTANVLDEWQLTAGNSKAFGAAVKIFAANDVKATDYSVTPVKFDLHRILITDVGTADKNYLIQFLNGEAGSVISTVPYRMSSTTSESAPVDIMMPRQSVTGEIWARVRCETNGGTLQFIVGVHVYAG